MSVILSYPFWFLLFCIAAGALYAGLLYWRNKKNSGLSVWVLRILAVVRFVAVTLLSFFLLGPLVKNVFKKIEKPVIVVLRDNSLSIPLNNDSVFYKSVFPAQLENFSTTLGGDYEVVQFNFGGGLTSASKLTYTEKITDIAQALDEVGLRYINRNLGAIVLATDGIYNQGMNPVYHAASLKVPVYTIALGDTTIKKDALIQEVVYNKVVFMGNQFPVDVNVIANKLPGNNSTLSITHNGKTLYTKGLSYTSDKFSVLQTAVLTADEPGTQRYRIAITGVQGEATTLNNYYDIFVDVIDSRQKILILTEFPHPDVGAWQQVINQNKNYQCEIGLVNSFNKNLKEYSLVIMHQLPSVTANASQFVQQIQTQQIPVLYTLGNNTHVANFNAVNTGVRITGNRNNYDDVQGSYNTSFTLFQVDESIVRYFPQLPPLSGPYGSSFEVSPATEILAYRKVGSVVTNYPLICFTNNNKHKMGVIMGEGIWKWRNYDYESHKNHEIFNALFNKIIQYVAVKEDKSFFRINSVQQFYENEPVVLFGELYNESYELINEPDIKLDIFSAENTRYSYTFSKTGKTYRLGAGVLPVGEYRYEGTVQYKGKTLKKTGRFIVKPIQLEALNTTANHDLLNKLSVGTGGKLFYPSQLEQLKQEIYNTKNITTTAYKQKQLKDLIHYRWIFFIILALLAAEWFIRKREGLV